MLARFLAVFENLPLLRNRLHILSRPARGPLQATRTWQKTLSLNVGSRPRWIFFGRQHDCTPIRLGFGMLEQFQHVARYWHRADSAGSAQLLDYRTYTSIHSTTLPSHGIIEMMAWRKQLSCYGEEALHSYPLTFECRPCLASGHQRTHAPASSDSLASGLLHTQAPASSMSGLWAPTHTCPSLQR